jgi:hypothetical protein
MTRRDTAAVFALCAVPRLLWLAFAPPPFESDYLVVANAIAAGTTGTLPSWHAALEPGYPLFLAVFPPEPAASSRRSRLCRPAAPASSL